MCTLNVCWTCASERSLICLLRYNGSINSPWRRHILDTSKKAAAIPTNAILPKRCSDFSGEKSSRSGCAVAATKKTNYPQAITSNNVFNAIGNWPVRR